MLVMDLLKNYADETRIAICNYDNGSIYYLGEFGNMPFKMWKFIRELEVAKVIHDDTLFIYVG